jgi:hypothetical protein
MLAIIAPRENQLYGLEGVREGICFPISPPIAPVIAPTIGPTRRWEYAESRVFAIPNAVASVQPLSRNSDQVDT